MREITDKVQYQTENEFHIELTQWERNHKTSSPSRPCYCTSQQNVNKSEHIIASVIEKICVRTCEKHFTVTFITLTDEDNCVDSLAKGVFDLLLVPILSEALLSRNVSRDYLHNVMDAML